MTRKRNPRPVPPVVCRYCSQPADLVTGEAIYPRRQDLAGKPFYRCTPCDAWVGCHSGTTRPLGHLANATLRKAKQRAHAAFDPLWKAKAETGVSRGRARGKAYSWLAAQLGIEQRDCHIGLFDITLCRRTVEICSPYAERLRLRHEMDLRRSADVADDHAGRGR